MNTPSVYLSAEGKAEVLRYYDMLMGHMTIPYETRMIPTRYGETSAIIAGDESAPPIVLLHGSSINATMWISDMQKLAGQYRVYALDLPGEPGKSAEVQLPFDTEDYATWLADTFAALDIERAVVMGASLGAWLSIKFAIAHPEKVRALVLLCPAGVGPQNHAFKDVALSLLAKGPAGIDELMTVINGGPIPEIMLTYQKMIAAVFNSRKEIIPMFTDDMLRGLTMPTILFMGERDIMLDAAQTTRRYREVVPTAEVVLMPKRGHSLTGLTEEIIAFLQRCGDACAPR